MKKIAIIGNAGGGKTTIARALGKLLELPVYHVDSIQYQSRWRQTPAEECTQSLDALIKEEHWIIDGFGSKEVMQRRFLAADLVILVDFPLWRHYWWASKRQLKSGLYPRAELPENCPEFSFHHTMRLFRIMWMVNKTYLPWLRNVLAEFPNEKVAHIRSVKEWKHFLENVK